MTTLEARYRNVTQRITTAAISAGRDPAAVRLLAVSKTFPAQAVRAVASLGQRSFGENYLQEAQSKIDMLGGVSAGPGTASGAGPALEWHFIGPIQSNKTGPIARLFDWVHSIERESIAVRLSRQRLETGLAPIEVCIQVNVSGEDTKSGCAPDQAQALACAIRALAGLRLRGVMAIPEPTTDPVLLRSRFRVAARLLDVIRAEATGAAACSGAPSNLYATSANGLDTLSMGMSADLETAIAEGSTIVRVGSALFGDRPPRQT